MRLDPAPHLRAHVRQGHVSRPGLSDKAGCVRTFDGPAISLPAGIDKPEGLARKPQGLWLVAVDNPDGVNALHIVDLTQRRQLRESHGSVRLVRVAAAAPATGCGGRCVRA